jgi:hypothetical protein
MNCAQIREQLVETARGRELPSDLRAIVFDHAGACAACAGLLDNQTQLTVALAELALYTDGAPARIEQVVRRQLPVPIVRKAVRVRWVWAGVSAIAAGLVMTVVLINHPSRVAENKPAQTIAVSHPPPIPTPPSVPAVSSTRAVPSKPITRQASNDWNADDFVPLPYAEEVSPDEQTDIVRVSLPRESLLALGLPVSAERFGDQVLADVLIGTDGTARAIRISD